MKDYDYDYVFGSVPTHIDLGLSLETPDWVYMNYLNDKILPLNPSSGNITFHIPNLEIDGVLWKDGLEMLVSKLMFNKLKYLLHFKKVWMKDNNDKEKNNGFILNFVKTEIDIIPVSKEKRERFKDRVGKYKSDFWLFENYEEIESLCTDFLTDANSVVYNPFKEIKKFSSHTPKNENENPFW
jgi:hypothetical protein